MNRKKMMERAQTQKQVNMILRHPDIEKFIREDTAQALAFCMLISADYLYRVRGYKKPGLEKFIDFVIKNLKYSAEDVEFFPLLNQAFIDEIGLDILQRFDIEIEREKK